MYLDRWYWRGEGHILSVGNTVPLNKIDKEIN